MTEQEKFNHEVQIKLSIHDEKFNSVMTKLDTTNTRMDDFISEMREENRMRHAEIAALSASTDAKVEAIRSSIESMGKHVRNLTITAMVGIIAAGAGIAAMVISALTKH